MWPFTKSKASKVYDAVNNSVELSRAAFGTYLQSGTLNEAMQADPYVAGYLSVRLIGSTMLAIQREGLDDRAFGPLHLMVIKKVFGAEWKVIADRVAEFKQNASTAGRYKQGQADAHRLQDYLLGIEDIRAHPLYSQIKSADDEFARNFPDLKAPDAQMNSVISLEALTFGKYISDHFRRS